MVTEKEFKKLRLKQKIIHLQMAGEFITERYYLNNKVYLYLYNNFFVEVWMRLGFEEVYSVDIAPEITLKEAYLGKIDLKKLGLEF